MSTMNSQHNSPEGRTHTSSYGPIHNALSRTDLWKLVERVINADETYDILKWFMASSIMQGATLSLMIPFLRSFFGRRDDTIVWLIAICVMGLITAVVDTMAMYRSYRVSVFDVCDSLIGRVAERVLSLPLGWFNAARQAAIVNATSTDVNTLSHLCSMVIPNVCNAFIIPAVLIIGTAFSDPLLALIMAAAVIPLVLIWRRMNSTITEANTLEDEAAAHTAHRFIEFAFLQPVLRATGMNHKGWKPALDALEQDNAATVKGMTIKGRPAQFFNITINCAFALIMGIGLIQVSGAHMDAIGYLAIMVVTARTLLPLTKGALYATEANHALVAMRNVGDILNAPVLGEPETPATAQGTEIHLNKVSFGYSERQRVLSDISLTIPEGTVTALVGPSGSGKSTILRLVARFWDVDNGSISIGGQDVRDLGSTRVMDMTSFVFQDVYLFNTTIRENVRIARPDASDDELETAAARAQLDKVIASLPQGWDTPVGPGGARLSGGERQRVAIARAFLKDAPILLLDEITSALDGENETAITAVIKELAKGRTVLVVAHRLSTMWDADTIVYLEPHESGSVIAQQGDPHELAHVDGPFKKLVDSAHASARWKLATES